GGVLCEQSLALYRKLGDTLGIALSLQRLAVVAWVRNNSPVARSLTEEALVLWREVGDKKHIAWVLTWLAYTASQQGEYARALALCEECLVLYREIGNREGTALSLSLLARVEASQGNHAAARALYEESLTMASKGMDDKGAIASCLEGLAGVVAAQGELAWAGRLLGAAEALREAMGVPLPPVFRDEYVREVTVVRANLGEKDFGSAWVEGRTMTPEQALAA